VQGDSPQGRGARNLHQPKTQAETKMKGFPLVIADFQSSQSLMISEEKN